MDKERKISRRFICVEIIIEKKHLYLFEAQRRPKDIAKVNDELNHKEALPILLLYSPGYEAQKGTDFLQIVEQTVIEKTWPNPKLVAPFVQDKISHCTAEDNIKDYADKLTKLLLRNFHQ